MSLSWGPQLPGQLVSKAGLPKPTSMLTHGLDSSHSPSFLCGSTKGEEPESAPCGLVKGCEDSALSGWLTR